MCQTFGFGKYTTPTREILHELSLIRSSDSIFIQMARFTVNAAVVIKIPYCVNS